MYVKGCSKVKKNDTSSPQVKRAPKKSKVIPFKKKKNYKKRFMFVLLIVLLVCTALFTPVFNIKQIEVRGNTKFKPQEVINMSGMPLGQNIFKINYFKVKNNIETNPYIEKVKISRVYPNRVRITIIERIPGAYFQFMNSYMIIDNNGIVLEVANSINNLTIPCIWGIGFKEYSVGETLTVNKEDKQKFVIAQECINEAISQKIINALSKIDLTNPNKITIWLFNDKYQTILSNEENISYNFKFLAEKIIPDLEKNKSAPGVIDFTTPNKPTYKPR